MDLVNYITFDLCLIVNQSHALSPEFHMRSHFFLQTGCVGSLRKRFENTEWQPLLCPKVSYMQLGESIHALLNNIWHYSVNFLLSSHPTDCNTLFKTSQHLLGERQLERWHVFYAALQNCMGCKYNSSNIRVALKIGWPTGLKLCKDSFYQKVAVSYFWRKKKQFKKMQQPTTKYVIYIYMRWYSKTRYERHTGSRMRSP